MKAVGKLYDMKVYSAEWVDKDTVYLINPKNLTIGTEIKNIKPLSLLDKTKHYLDVLFMALKGKI